MPELPENTLNAAERIKLKTQVDRLFAEGRWVKAFPLNAVYLAEKAAPLFPPVQIGVSVPKKNISKATGRNYTKRLMRECYRIQKHELVETARSKDSQLLVFFVYSGRKKPDYAEICGSMDRLLRQLIKELEKQ